MCAVLRAYVPVDDTLAQAHAHYLLRMEEEGIRAATPDAYDGMALWKRSPENPFPI